MQTEAKPEAAAAVAVQAHAMQQDTPATPTAQPADAPTNGPVKGGLHVAARRSTPHVAPSISFSAGHIYQVSARSVPLVLTSITVAASTSSVG